MQSQKPITVLVLCTGNSARSILGEVLINELGGGRFRAYSAGSQPAGRVNPGAIRKLEREGLPTDGLESKSWDRFSGADAEPIDIAITVCDNAANETCPVWHGSPLIAHWGIPDPAAADEAGLDAAFDAAFDRLKRRIDALVSLPLEDLDPESATEALKGVHALALGQEASDD